MKKNVLARAALAAICAVALAGCNSSSDPSDASVSPSGDSSLSGGTAADLAALRSITWSEDADGATTLSFDTPLHVSASAALVVEDGDGEALALGQDLQIDYIVVGGDDGALQYSTFDLGATEPLVLADGGLDPVLIDALVGSHVGVHLIYGVQDPNGADPAASGPAPSAFVAITVVSASTPLARAEGTAVAPVAGLPVVTLDASGAPSIVIPATAEPTELVAQNLIDGDGAVVLAGQTILAHYTGWLWNGTSFDSSWERAEPLRIALAPGAVIDGWTQGLVGKKIGSQVLLIIPPELAYGDTEKEGIPAGSTLVFVVDILAAS